MNNGSTKPGDRMLDNLPAIYRAADQSGQLRALLAAFETILLDSADPKAPSFSQQIDAILACLRRSVSTLRRMGRPILMRARPTGFCRGLRSGSRSVLTGCSRLTG